jgi:hypothetical protein
MPTISGSESDDKEAAGVGYSIPTSVVKKLFVGCVRRSVISIIKGLIISPQRLTMNIEEVDKKLSNGKTAKAR